MDDSDWSSLGAAAEAEAEAEAESVRMRDWTRLDSRWTGGGKMRREDEDDDDKLIAREIVGKA